MLKRSHPLSRKQVASLSAMDVSNAFDQQSIVLPAGDQKIGKIECMDALVWSGDHPRHSIDRILNKIPEDLAYLLRRFLCSCPTLLLSSSDACLTLSRARQVGSSRSSWMV